MRNVKNNEGEKLKAGSSKLEWGVSVSVGPEVDRAGSITSGREHAMSRRARATRWLQERAWKVGRRRPVVDLADAVKAVEMAWGIKLK